MPKSKQESRREKGTGSFRKLPNGKVELREWIEIGGVRRRKTVTGVSKMDCRNRISEYVIAENERIRIEKDEARNPKINAKKVSELADIWLDVYKKPVEGQNAYSYRNYKGKVENYIKPAIGEMMSDEVQPVDIIALIKNARTSKGNPLARSTAEKLLWALKGIFDMAVENKNCFSNPTKKVASKALPAKTEKKPVAFSEYEINAITGFMKQHPFGPKFALYTYSAIRPGEGFGLEWTDINTVTCTMSLHQSLSLVLENGKYVYKITPGLKRKAEHTVSYNPRLNEYLDMLPKVSKYVLAREVVVYNGPKKKSITTYTHYDHTTFNKEYYAFLNDLNMYLVENMETGGEEDVTVGRKSPHKTRHTVAVFLRKNGADLNEIREILGHASITTTEIYDYVDISDQRKAMAKLPF